MQDNFPSSPEGIDCHNRSSSVWKLFIHPSSSHQDNGLKFKLIQNCLIESELGISHEYSFSYYDGIGYVLG